MTTRGIPKKSARLFRIVHGFYGLLFTGVALWIFSTSDRWVLASIFAVAGVIGIINAIVGWQPTEP